MTEIPKDFDKNSGRNGLTLQEYLSLGYLFLIILGLAKDVIMFSFLNVEILYYSSILDILISPIAIFSEKPILAPFIIGLTWFLFYLQRTVLPKVHFKYRDRKWYSKINDVEKLDRRYSQTLSINGVLVMVALGLSSLYLGLGLGTGQKQAERISQGNMEVDHYVHFQSGDSKEVEIIGVNSEFVFFVEKGARKVTVVPIKDNVVGINKVEDI